MLEIVINIRIVYYIAKKRVDHWTRLITETGGIVGSIKKM